jgi:hypothetical protein
VFQQIASCTTSRHRDEGQRPGTNRTFHLRTVIVHLVRISLSGVDHIFIPPASWRELCVWPLRIPDCSSPGSRRRSRGSRSSPHRAGMFTAGPFLLIVRTGWIVTVHSQTLRRGCDSYGRVPPDTRSFQHIAELLSRGLLLEGRNSVFTAAVYRGLVSELRPYGLTLPRNLPAPGRRQSVYIVLRLRTLLCF